MGEATRRCEVPDLPGCVSLLFGLRLSLGCVADHAPFQAARPQNGAGHQADQAVCLCCLSLGSPWAGFMHLPRLLEHRVGQATRGCAHLALPGCLVMLLVSVCWGVKVCAWLGDWPQL